MKHSNNQCIKCRFLLAILFLISLFVRGNCCHKLTLCDRPGFSINLESVCTWYLVEYEKCLVGKYIVIKSVTTTTSPQTHHTMLSSSLWARSFTFLVLGYHGDGVNYCSFVVEITHISKQCSRKKSLLMESTGIN